jgi:hypothetical protein
VKRLLIALMVLPGKDTGAVPATFTGRFDDYLESRARLGITMERYFTHQTPTATFSVAYVETEWGFDESLRLLASSDLAIDRDFRAALMDVFGFDTTQPLPGGAPLPLVEWVDPDVTTRKPGAGFCLPVAPGKTDESLWWREEAMNRRPDEFIASRRAMRSSVEVVALTKTRGGDVMCVYIEADDPFDAQRRFAESTTPYDLWFKERLAATSTPDVDFNKPIQGLSQTWDWHQLAS